MAIFFLAGGSYEENHDQKFYRTIRHTIVKTAKSIFRWQKIHHTIRHINFRFQDSKFVWEIDFCSSEQYFSKL
jgi:hypothetical protein